MVDTSNVKLGTSSLEPVVALFKSSFIKVTLKSQISPLIKIFVEKKH